MKEKKQSHYEMLYEQHQKRLEKKESKRELLRRNETQGCTFYPMELPSKVMNQKINGRSNKVL